MSISVKCAQCQQPMTVSDERAGSRVRCKVCGSSVNVPGASGGSGSRAPSRSKSGKSKSGSSGSGLALGLGIGAGVLLLALMAGGALLFLNRGGLLAPAADPAADAVAAAAPRAPGTAVPATPLTPGAANPTTPPTAAPGPGMPPATNPGALPGAPVATSPALNPATPTPATTSPAAAAAAPIPEPDVPWSVTADPPAAAVEWPETLSWKIKFQEDAEKALYPALPSPFVVLGIKGYDTDASEVFDLRTGKSAGKLKGKPDTLNRVALSPDGKLLVVSLLQKKGKAQTWSYETGEMLAEWDICDPQDNTQTLAFTAPELVVSAGFTKVGGALRKQIRVTNALTGEHVQEILTEQDVDFGKVAVSPGGRFLVSLTATNGLSGFNLATGERAGTLATPDKSAGGDSMTRTALAWSPDGARIAVLLSSTWETRIVVMAAESGQIEHDVAISGQLRYLADNDVLYKGDKLQWSPDGRRIMVSGQLLVDLPSGRLVWSLEVLPTEDEYHLTNNAERRLLGRYVAIAEGPPQAPVLTPLKIDEDSIAAALAAVEGGEAALKPGQSVAIHVETASLRFGDPEKTGQEITEVLTDRLDAEGLTVSADAETALTIKYAEAEGNKLSLSTRPLIPGGPGGAPPPAATGQTVTSTKVVVEVAWMSGKRTLWSKLVTIDPNFLIFRGDASDASARESVFKQVQEVLYALPFPWYIAADNPKLSLPIRETLQTESRMSTRPRRRR